MLSLVFQLYSLLSTNRIMISPFFFIYSLICFSVFQRCWWRLNLLLCRSDIASQEVLTLFESAQVKLLLNGVRFTYML